LRTSPLNAPIGVWIVLEAVSTKVTDAFGTYEMTPACVTSKARVKLRARR